MNILAEIEDIELVNKDVKNKFYWTIIGDNIQ